jgi:hypothetical protein
MLKDTGDYLEQLVNNLVQHYLYFRDYPSRVTAQALQLN